MSRITVESATVEAVKVTITTRLDPTADAIEFQLTDNNTTTPTGSWTGGTWDGTWSAVTGKVSAFSPPIGGTGFLLTERTHHKLWVRWTISSETPVMLAATILAT